MSDEAGILTAVAATLRYITHWDLGECASDLAGIAADVDRLRTAPHDDLDWACCPICQEILCDTDCPLSAIRQRANGVTARPVTPS